MTFSPFRALCRFRKIWISTKYQQSQFEHPPFLRQIEQYRQMIPPSAYNVSYMWAFMTFRVTSLPEKFDVEYVVFDCLLLSLKATLEATMISLLHCWHQVQETMNATVFLCLNKRNKKFKLKKVKVHYFLISRVPCSNTAISSSFKVFFESFSS